MKTSRWKKIWWKREAPARVLGRDLRRGLALVALAFGILTAGCVVLPQAPQPDAVLSAEQRRVENLQTLDRVWELVNRRFHDANFKGVDWTSVREKIRPEVEAATDDDALYAAINRMLAELQDSHTYAMKPRDVADELQKERARVGFTIARVNDRWLIIDVAPDSPAEEAGVQRGWILIARDGRPVGENAQFRLEAGQTVTDEYLDHKDERRTVQMTARPISTAPRREVRKLDGEIVYLRFDHFDRESRRWLSNQLKAHREAPGVIIDLRANPGGQAFSLGFTIGEFFPRSMDYGTFIRRSGWRSDVDSLQWGSAKYPGKVAVLVDGSSASCAEIFAHALQHHRRAVIVGRKTAGAVIGSWYYSLPRGGRLSLGVFDYRGLDGKQIEGVGVTPDVAEEITIADLRAGRDADLEAALRALNETTLAVQTRGQR